VQALTQESLAETPVAVNGLEWLFVTVPDDDPELELAIVEIDGECDDYGYSFYHRQGVDYELPSIQ
jgi:hypothetical protein